MSRSLRRGALAAALTLSIAPLAACGAGADSQTLQVQPNTVKTTAGVISIQNAVVVTEPNGTGAASFSARIFNNGSSPQQLTGITVQGTGTQLKLTGTDGKGGPLTIPANGSIGLGGAGNASAIIEDAGQAGVHPGAYQPLALQFSTTGQVTVSANVTPAVSYFSSYGPGVTAVPATPSAVPTGSVSATGSAKPGTPASAKASEPAGASKAPSPSASH